MSDVLTTSLVQARAGRDPGEPVLTIVLRTDPRDPANTAGTPAWAIGLRNGLRAVAETLEGQARDERLAFRELRERVQDDLLALGPAERARGIAAFVTPSRSVDHRVTLQLPPVDHVVRWDRRPFVSPLVAVADRGRPTGLVLVGRDAVRLLHWEAGRVEEPEDSLYELELGDWRPYAAYAMVNPARAQQTATHSESYEHSVDGNSWTILDACDPRVPGFARWHPASATRPYFGPAKGTVSAVMWRHAGDAASETCREPDIGRRAQKGRALAGTSSQDHTLWPRGSNLTRVDYR
jgi:hypothetical protein